MRRSLALAIYGKEVRETLRDRRTLLVMVGAPILVYPLMILLGGAAVASHFDRVAKRPMRVAVWGEDAARAKEALTSDPDARFQIVDVPEPRDAASRCAAAREALVAGRAQAIIRVDSADWCDDGDGGEIGADPATGGPLGSFEILYDGADDYSSSAETEVRRVLRRFSRDALKGILQRAGLDPELSAPYRVTETDLAGERRTGGRLLGQILPGVLLLMCGLGSYYCAIDAVAGEKERRTLGTLLGAPVRPFEIALGKYLGVLTVSLLASAANLLALGSSTTWLVVRLDLVQHSVATNPLILAKIGALLAISAAFLSGLMLGVASLARDTKDAQSLITPFYLVLAVLAMAAGLPGMELRLATAVVPVFGIALVIRHVLEGTATVAATTVAVASHAAYALFCIWGCAVLLRSERVVFREARK